MVDSSGYEKEVKQAELPRMNDNEAREFTKKLKEEAADDLLEDERSERIAGLGYKM